MESFGGAGFCHIIDINGDFVVRSPNPIVEPIADDNYFAVLEQQGVLDSGYSIPAVKEDIAAGLTGILYFSLEDGIHKAMAYVPLEMNQWSVSYTHLARAFWVPSSACGCAGSPACTTCLLYTSLFVVNMGMPVGQLCMTREINIICHRGFEHVRI